MPANTTAATNKLTVDAITAALDEATVARDTRNREERLRRKLRRLDHILCKTPPTHWSRPFHGVGYQIVSASNYVVAGCGNREFEMTLEEAEEFAADLAKEVA